MADSPTLKSTLDASQVTIYNAAVYVSGEPYAGLDNFVDVKESINGAGVEFTFYTNLSAATTALTDGTDVEAVAMADAKVTVTPAEYGNVITTTKLANTSTAGKADIGAAKLVGRNMGETQSKQICAILEAGTNSTAAATSGTLAKADIRGAVVKLQSASIAPFDGIRYVLMVNPAQKADIQDGINTIVQYTDAEMALGNRAGEYEGCIVVAHPQITAGTAVVFGQNALAKAEAVAPMPTIVEGTDKLGRTRHYGWYGVYKYSILDQNAVQVITGC